MIAYRKTIMQIRFKKLTLTATLPEYATPGASGLDLCADIATRTIIHKGERKLIPTGLSIELPAGYEAQVRPRSGLALKHGVTVLNSPGTVDADYRGQIGVILVNLGEYAYDIMPGDRIAQLVIAPVVQAKIVEQEALSETARGEGGFGSTGKSSRQAERQDESAVPAIIIHPSGSLGEEVDSEGGKA